MQQLSRSRVAFNLFLGSGDFPPQKKKFVYIFFSELGVFSALLQGIFRMLSAAGHFQAGPVFACRA